MPSARRTLHLFVCVTTLLLAPRMASGISPVGTFQWQFAPFCNVLTLTVLQEGTVFLLNGSDDSCGAASASSVTGTASLGPDGSVLMGVILVTGNGLTVSVSISLDPSTLAGTWVDSMGNSGNFVPNPPSPTTGAPRPAPSAVVGPVGPTGPAGSTGPIGPPGPQGLPGPAAPQGAIVGQAEVPCNQDASDIFVFIVGRSFFAVTGPNGAFTLSGLPPGNYTLRLEIASPNAVLELPVTVVAEQTTDVGARRLGPDCDTDPNNCGAVGTVCPSGQCQGGQCLPPPQQCQPGVQQACYTGPGGTQGVGICIGGMRTCLPDGSGFGPCVGEILPNAESCNTLDDDCDGQVDEGFNLVSDPNNCGTCGTVCAIGEVCVAGVCQ
jgi:hypothetical protein